MKTRVTVALSGVLLLAGTAGAGVVHDESVDGDLSTDPLSPTAVAFALGSNTIVGSVTSAPPGDTRDYLTFTIGAGQQLSAINLLMWDDPAGPIGNTGFHAIIAGGTSFVPDGGTIGSFLGGDHVDDADEGTDMLPDLAAAVLGGTGFGGTLGPGTYTYHVQQTGQDMSLYTIEFVVTPAPGAAALLGLSGLALARRRR